MKVMNVKEYAKKYDWIVARECDDELWFWGAYHDYSKAMDAAVEIGGIVIPTGFLE